MTPRPGQAPFRYFRKYFITVSGLVLLAGCQNGQKPMVTPMPAAVGPQAALPFKPRPALPVVVQPQATAPIPQPVGTGDVHVTIPEPTATGPSETRVFTLSHGRMVSMSTEQWVAVPARAYSLADSSPSLLEDASITSNLHTRLKALLATRESGIQCRTTSGKVTLTAGQLTPEQAVLILDEALSFDKVREVRLVAKIGS